jgi:hypothetical protein
MWNSTSDTPPRRPDELEYVLDCVDQYLWDDSDIRFVATYFFYVKIPCTCGTIAVTCIKVFVEETEITDVEFAYTSDHCGCWHVLSHYNDIEDYIYDHFTVPSLRDMSLLNGCPINLVYVQK